MQKRSGVRQQVLERECLENPRQCGRQRSGCPRAALAGVPLVSASALSLLCDAVWNSDTDADGLRWLRIGERGRMRDEGRVESGDFANIYSGEVITRSRKNLIHQSTADNVLTPGNRPGKKDPKHGKSPGYNPLCRSIRSSRNCPHPATLQRSWPSL